MREHTLHTNLKRVLTKCSWAAAHDPRGAPGNSCKGCKNTLEIGGSQEFALAGLQPALAGLRLTLGAVPISARVVRDGLVAAT